MTDKKKLEEKAKQYGDIAVLADTAGGKHLVKTLNTDTVNNIMSIIRNYRTISHSELIAICADLRANVDMLRVLKNAKDNQEEADKMLKEMIEQEL